MKKKQHTHRYERAVIGKKGYTVFRCNLPDCTHYIAASLVKGKLSICNRDSNHTLIMDTRAMNLEKPHCVDCIQVRKKDSHDSILAFLDEVVKPDDVHS